MIFSGEENAVTLVRRSLPVEMPPGLEVIRLAPQSGHADVTLARSRAPLPFGSFLAEPIDPSPVVLLRPPYSIRFAYADTDRQWRTTWHDQGHIPLLIRIAIVDRGTGRDLLPPVVVRIRVDAPPLCATIATTARSCDIAMGRDPGPAPAGLPGLPAIPAAPGTQ
jgi:general secretion pathway protein J